MCDFPSDCYCGEDVEGLTLVLRKGYIAWTDEENVIRHRHNLGPTKLPVEAPEFPKLLGELFDDPDNKALRKKCQKALITYLASEATTGGGGASRLKALETVGEQLGLLLTPETESKDEWLVIMMSSGAVAGRDEERRILDELWAAE